MATTAVLVLLAVTTSSVVGLLGVWAGLGRGHWFVRVAVVGAVLGLALLIPAYELAVPYAIQCLVVVPPLVLARRLRTRGEGNHAMQFTLRDLILLTAVVAVLSAVGVNVPQEMWTSWSFLGVIPTFFGATEIPPWIDCLVTGMAWGGVTLAATWLVLGRGRRRLWVPPFLLAVIFVAGVVGGMVLSDFRSSLLDATGYSIGMLAKQLSPNVWSPAITLILLLPFVPIAAFLWLFHLQAKPPEASLKKRRSGARVLLGLLGVVLFVPPAWAYYILIPPPILNDPLPEPNGYDALLATCKQLENVTVPDDGKNFPEAERATPKDYRDFCSKYHAVPASVHEALENECQVPLTYDSLTETWKMGHLAQAMAAHGDAALMDGDAATASQYYRDTIRLGRATARGGIVSHWLSGSVVEGVALRHIHNHRDKMTETTRRQWIAAIPTFESDFEPLEECQIREEIWSQRVCGWQERLVWVIDNSLGIDDSWVNNFRLLSTIPLEQSQSLRRAQYRILLLELALDEYHAKHGAYPERLADLVPEVIEKTPDDPFSGQPLVYRRTPKDYRLHSVVPNDVDDGGKSADANPNDQGDDVWFW